MSDPVRTYLTVIAGPKAGTKYELDPVDNLLIGSDESCPFCIDAPGISPIHARIWADAEGITVFDTHSPMGIYVNDDKVVEKSPLRNGDILWLGSPGDEDSVMIQVSTGSAPEVEAVAQGGGAEAALDEPYPADVAAMPETAMPEPAMPEPAMPEPVEAFEPEMPPEPTAMPEEPFAAAPPEPAPVPEPIETFDTEMPPPMPEDAPPTTPSFQAQPEEVVEAGSFDSASAFEVVPSPPEPEPVPVETASPETFEAFEEPPPLPPSPSAEPSPSFAEAEPEAETIAITPPPPVAFSSEAPAAGADDAFFVPQEEPPPPPVVAAAHEAPEAAADSAFFVDEPTAPIPPPVAAPEEVDAPPPPPKPAPPPPAAATKPAKPAAPPAAKKPVEPRKPAAAAARPAAASRPAPSPRPGAKASGGGPPMGLLIGIGVLVIGGGAAAYFMMGGSKPTPPTPPPSSVAAVVTTLPPPQTVPPAAAATPAPAPSAEPTPAAVATPEPTPPPVAATPPPVTAATPRPVATPSAKPTPSPAKPTATAAPATPAPPSEAQLAQQRAAQVNTLLGQAEAAAIAHNVDQAVSLFDQVLKLDPQNAKAAAGKSAALASATSLKKAFVPGKTAFIGKAKKGPAGFADNEEPDPDYQGRIDYEFSPANVKPGDAYSAKVYLVNEGKRAIKVNTMSLTTVANGQRTPGPGNPQTKDIAAGQKGLLATVNGTWKDGTTSWSLEAIVTSARGEIYNSRVTWR